MNIFFLAILLAARVEFVANADPDSLQEQLERFVSVDTPVLQNPTVRDAAREYIFAKQLADSDYHIEAIRHYRKSAELDTSSPAPWVGMAVSLGAIEQDDTAILVWKEVITRDPSHPDALLILGIDAAKMGQMEQGKHFLSRHWLSNTPEPIEALLRLAAMLFVFESDSDISVLLENEINSVLSEAGIALSTAPSAAWLGVLQQLIDLDATELAMQLAVVNAPDVNQKELGALLTVLPVLESAIDGNGLTTQTLYEEMSQVGKLQLSSHLSERVSLAEALSIAAQSMSIIGGDIEAPVRLYEKSLELSPNNPLALNNLAWITMEQNGVTPYVQQLCKRALELDSKATYILDTVGRMYTLLGDDSNALLYLTEALERSEQPSPEMYDHLGDALWIAGEQERAEQMWKVASKIFQSPEYRQITLEEYAARTHSVWGIMVTTPEALYDFEMGSVIHRLDEKLTALTQGREPDLGFVVPTNGVN